MLVIPDFIKRWLVFGALAVTLGVFGFIKGMAYEQGVNQGKLAAGVVYVQKKTAAVQQIADTQGETTQKAQDKIKVVYRTLIQKEIEYVKNDPTSSTVLPVGFVRNYNAASVACDLAEPACVTVSEPTGPVTLADLIHQYNQASNYYHSCKVALDGYEAFYQKVRKEVNKDQPNGDDE